ncbi:sigma-54-dependent transcriptional regulator [Tropicimonas isoalkanivorans]|uniref:Nif-specific regulatory protein n=1 Tax=Tropicimonas isoalkanivorans TaxID=441112 RepID=A0A1I1DH94_9RHOB|nr:sigma-54 dependent transcriptional regulator [Tropicimonas isoalkanivorans]SFB71913.1 DNA-binding transcriptional response regulator, NtrC family, contains REC, AAA-type ATPase, and a Fis-type DNA-binding domains [Tropicimonas isoalkanivorans]
MTAATQRTVVSSAEDYGGNLSGASVLVIDDEPGMRNFLTKVLGPRVKCVEQAGSPLEATAKLDVGHFDVLILDNVMPGMKGLDWINDQRRKGFFGDVILITAYADLETAIAALRAGIGDFVLKPFRANQILGAIERTLDRKHLRRENALLRRELYARTARGKLLGTSEALASVLSMLKRLAPLPTPVLFLGASGTGKELAAEHLHEMSDRSEAPFVAVNCAVLDPDRIAAELFGVIEESGRLKPGLFMLADGGTLFLDEVAQMPDQLQAALLRVLDDKKIRPVGAEREIPLDLRFLFATNADLHQAVTEGRFRVDLYHRINVFTIKMPPLRDRSEDIVELAAQFMEQFSNTLGMASLELNEDTLLKLRRYDWPGNVRELKNLIERSVILGEFPEEFAGSSAVTAPEAIENLDLVTKRHILHVLDQCAGNRAEAARRLGVSRKTIDRKMAAWGL